MAQFARREQATIKLAQEIIDMGLTLIYGGSYLGMLGLLATTVKFLGGKAIGVITIHLLERKTIGNSGRVACG